MWTSLSTNSLSRSSRSRSRSLAICLSVIRYRCRRLELQPAFAGSVGECLHSAVIEIAAAIEDDLRNPGCDGSLGNQLANLAGSGGVRAGLELLAEGLVERGGRRDRAAAGVVDHLRINMLGRAENAEPQPAFGRLADGAADTGGAAIC